MPSLSSVPTRSATLLEVLRLSNSIVRHRFAYRRGESQDRYLIDNEPPTTSHHLRHNTKHTNMSTPQLDLKKPAEPAADAKAEVKEEKLSSDALTKYQTASALLGDVLKKFIPTVVEGKSVLDLCNE